MKLYKFICLLLRIVIGILIYLAFLIFNLFYLLIESILYFEGEVPDISKNFKW